MRLLRGVLIGCAIVVLAAGVQAADKAKKGKEFGDDYKVPLVDPEFLPKLNLTADQKKSVDALCKEFDQKNAEAIAIGKDTVQKAKDELKEAQKNKDKAATAAAQKKLKEANGALDKLRKDYDAKFQAMLTDDQKKALEAAKTGN